MGRLIYSFNVSLDGFIETRDRRIDWGLVDEELHTWFNDQARTIGASIYGRRLYELMNAYWPTAGDNPDASETERDFAATWNATPRYVFSRTRTSVEGAGRLVTGDIGDRLAEIRAAHPGNVDVGGATLAASFIERDLVDEYQLLVHPIVLGGGTRYFPALERELSLKLVETRTFASGVVYLGYRRPDR